MLSSLNDDEFYLRTVIFYESNQKNHRCVFGGAYDYVNLRMQHKTGMVIQG